MRVLSRLIRDAKPLVQTELASVRDAFRSRLRSTRRLLQQIHRVRRLKGDEAAEQQQGLYQRLLAVTRQMVRQAERVRHALVPLAAPEAVRATAAGSGPSASSPVSRAAGRLVAQFDQFLPLMERGMEHARRRVLEGQSVASTAKVLSLFEPQTRVVQRGKMGAAVEFGRQVMLDEVEGGFVTRFQVLADGESECHQGLPAIQHHRAVFGQSPWLVTGDRRLHTRGLEDAAQRLGVTHVVVPRMGRLSAAQQARERERSWRRRYRWRAGIEGRIHSLRRDYGLARSRSHGEIGLERDVGWGVLASDLRHLASAQAQRQQIAARQVA